MNYKKSISKFVGIASVLLLTACGGNESSDSVSTTSNNDELVIEIVAKGFQHQFWKSVNDGANEAAEEFGARINFVGPANETAIQEQVQMLNNAVNKKPDAIVLASLDTASQIDLLKQASEGAIPIVGFDSGVPGAPEGSIVANASTDNNAAAAIGADKIFEAVKVKLNEATVDQPVRIGVISQEVNSQSITDRTTGFIDRMVELLSKIEGLDGKIAVVGHDKFTNGVSESAAAVIIDLQVPAQLTDAAGQTTGQTLLNKKDTIAVFASNEFAAKAIINANSAVGGVLGIDTSNNDIIGVGFDSGAIQKDAVKNNVLLGSITQDPVSIGYKSVELAVKAANGEDVSDVDTGAVWYDSSNIENADIAPLLYD